MNKINKQKIKVWVNMIVAILIILAVVFVGVGIVYAINYGMVNMYANIVNLSIGYEHIMMIFNLNLLYGYVFYRISKIIFKKYKKYYDNK